MVVLTDQRGGTGVVTLNRPEVRNALDLRLRAELTRVLHEFDADPEVLVVVLTGGPEVFCAGRDLKAARAGEPMYPSRRAALESFGRATITKPVVAAVEGWALGGGFELALSCDLVVAAENARFGLPEVTRNLVAIGGALVRLPHRMPYHLVQELALTGQPWTAEALARWGVVNRVTAPGRALDGACVLAEVIAANGPSAVRATKEILRASQDGPGERLAFDAQQAMAEPALTSPDRDEGIKAFLEKRAPVWTDR